MPDIGPQLLVDAKAAATLLSISPRHLANLDKSGALGPQAVKLGRRKLWAVSFLKAWVDQGCPGREKFQSGGTSNV